ncbi:small ribosomal subunit protein bS21m [Penaeus vannamei]|uniref:Ribosomal protein S21 n=1 Tax=Penaeus vannamei TaxID=6689 RepID=A0A423TN74_PENVA|nr:28S ribosomal protein S21, mitochondrial-like [Penaeus vannamei]ROT77910.1 ribosomal protein S21 [Penaeus vannamei]
MGIGHKHVQFVGKTVLVRNNNIEEGMRVVNRIMGREGLFEQYRLTRYYEKPFQTRRRINFEKAKAIYNEDMNRKIQFVMRKNRLNPWIGCA